MRRAWKTTLQSAYPKGPPLPTGDCGAQRQREHCTPKQLDHNVREWVCGVGTYWYGGVCTGLGYQQSYPNVFQNQPPMSTTTVFLMVTLTVSPLFFL